MRGKNCKIKTIEEVTGGQKITFEWTADDGSSKTSTMTVKDGYSVQSAVIDADNHLIFTLTDGSTIDAGELDTSGSLSEELVATVDIGTVTKGKVYPAGTSFEQILRDILIKEEAPAITLSTTPSASVYNVVTDTLSTIKLTANITKKSYAPKSVTFYAGSNVIDTQNITDGGTYEYQYTPATPINTDVTFKALVFDGKLTNSSSKTIKFVAKSYWGFVDATVTAPVESDIKGLQNNDLKIAKGLTYSDIIMDNSKIVYAYPKSFGALTSIVSKEGYDYMSSYTRTETKVDNIDYYVYTLTVETTIETAGFKQIFS